MSQAVRLQWLIQTRKYGSNFSSVFFFWHFQLVKKKSFSKIDPHNIQERQHISMSLSDKKMTEDESGSLKRSKKKQKKEDAWKSEGSKDPIVMVCVFVWVHTCWGYVLSLPLLRLNKLNGFTMPKNRWFKLISYTSYFKNTLYILLSRPSYEGNKLLYVTMAIMMPLSLEWHNKSSSIVCPCQIICYSKNYLRINY